MESAQLISNKIKEAHHNAKILLGFSLPLLNFPAAISAIYVLVVADFRYNNSQNVRENALFRVISIVLQIIAQLVSYIEIIGSQTFLVFAILFTIILKEEDIKAGRIVGYVFFPLYVAMFTLTMFAYRYVKLTFKSLAQIRINIFEDIYFRNEIQHKSLIYYTHAVLVCSILALNLPVFICTVFIIYILEGGYNVYQEYKLYFDIFKKFALIFSMLGTIIGGVLLILGIFMVIFASGNAKSAGVQNFAFGLYLFMTSLIQFLYSRKIYQGLMVLYENQNKLI